MGSCSEKLTFSYLIIGSLIAEPVKNPKGKHDKQEDTENPQIGPSWRILL